jgi:hypothetical protein
MLGRDETLRNWSQILKEGPIDWLLEPSNPSVRYLTLRELLDESENNPQAIAVRKAIPTSTPVTKIMSKQHPEDFWENLANG